ncbi:serine hydrolase [Uliginosibacterium sp. H1]|uniref:serine hydrolase n=1 Tax=Uliginosibacterium sp. H1 TaxID=3114757 RepID=UPI002E19F984|nr:serine hydrolase [Uliginosibacterium sp. H1]
MKRLSTGETYSHAADQPWYLSSTVKVPIAITVLRQVDAGKLSLQTPLTLQEQDKVDGAGELSWAENGSRYTVESLLTRMLGVSDNTAANLLIRTVGIDNLNSTAKSLLGSKVELTSFVTVRREIYAELHPDARRLDNQQLIKVAGPDIGPQRVAAVRRELDLRERDLKAKNFSEAYARYYQRGMNTATLQGYGDMLEQLVRGKLLSAQSTQAIFKMMKYGRRGDYRLEGGIPKSEMIIHKTGTQHRRACHMAVINPQDVARAIVVTTCASDINDRTEAGVVFQRVGKAVSDVLISRTEAESQAVRKPAPLAGAAAGTTPR